LGGAALMLLVEATDAEHAFFSEEAGIDWNVIFLLLGMMLIIAVLQRGAGVGSRSPERLTTAPDLGELRRASVRREPDDICQPDRAS
jgi:hypothetical protein